MLTWWSKRSPRYTPGPTLGAAWTALTVDQRLELQRLALASPEELQATLERCELAGLLLDGDISEVAKKWVATTVARRLGSRARKQPDRGLVAVAFAACIAGLALLGVMTARHLPEIPAAHGGA